MTPIPAESFLTQLKWRYACKKFDPARKVPEGTWAAIEQAAILAPSSFGIQPWKFVVITDPAVKAKLPAISWNQQQPKDCSHMVVVAARVGIDASDIRRYIERIAKVRGMAVDHPDLVTFSNTMLGTVNSLAKEKADVWSSRQCYIALGFLLTACAALGVDACPMEGIQHDEYDKLLGLDKLGYHAMCSAAVGYRAADDWLAGLAKVRFDAKDVVIRI